jgi:chaperonin GroEL
MQDIGVYGHIEVKPSHNSFTKIDKVKGIKFHKGFYAPHFLSDTQKMIWKAQGVYIVLYDGVVRSMNDLNEFFKEINRESNNPILFVVQSIEPQVLQSLINTKLVNPQAFNVMFTEFDGFGDRKTEIANDIAALTGAAVFGEGKQGIVGYAKEVIVDEDSTSILDGAADKAVVDELVAITESILEDKELAESERVYYKRRLATLAGGVAVIHVGAPTEVEMKEKKDRIDDAVEAVRASIDRGISIGGCYTLANCVKHLVELKDSKGNYLHVRPGYKLVLSALLEPLRQLLFNSDVYEEFKEVFDKLINKQGYNVISNSFYDLEDYTIYDPTGVLIDSLTNAISVSKSILSIERAVHNK